MAEVTAAWWKSNAPAPIKAGEIAKALGELAKTFAKYEKDGNSEPYLKALDSIAKNAVAKDLSKAKDDKEVKKFLDEFKKSVETEKKKKEQDLFSVAKEEG